MKNALPWNGLDALMPFETTRVMFVFWVFLYACAHLLWSIQSVVQSFFIAAAFFRPPCALLEVTAAGLADRFGAGCRRSTPLTD